MVPLVWGHRSSCARYEPLLSWLFSPCQLTEAKRTQNGVPGRCSLKQLRQPHGLSLLGVSVARPWPRAHHLLPARARLRWAPTEPAAARGFSSKIEFIAKNVLISDSSYLH